MKLSQGCLLGLVVLLTAFAVYFYVRRDNLPELALQKSLQMFKREIQAKGPSAYSQTELEQLFDATNQKLRSMRFDDPQVKALHARVLGILQDNRIDSLEVQALLDHLKRLSARD